MIVLLKYELIIVKCKKETKRDDFKLLIPPIVQNEKRFVESQETIKSGQIINYRWSVIHF